MPGLPVNYKRMYGSSFWSNTFADPAPPPRPFWSFSAAFKEMLEKGAPSPSRNDGDVDAAIKSATKVLDLIYELPALSHGQMEPLNFFADVRNGKADLYGPTQVRGRSEVRYQKH